MASIFKTLMVAGLAAGTAGLAVAQAPSPTAAAKPFVAPGTPGSPINGEIFHAQVLLDVAGFPAGVIDGKKGMSFAQALRGFQKAKDLAVTGKLDAATRSALIAQNRASTVMVKLSPDQVAGPFINPIPKDTGDKAKLPGLYYRNMLEKLAEAFHTTPETIIALNGADKMIGVGQSCACPTSFRPAGPMAIPQRTMWSR